MDIWILTRQQRTAQLPRWSLCFAQLFVFLSRGRNHLRTLSLSWPWSIFPGLPLKKHIFVMSKKKEAVSTTSRVGLREKSQSPLYHDITFKFRFRKCPRLQKMQKNSARHEHMYTGVQVTGYYSNIIEEIGPYHIAKCTLLLHTLKTGKIITVKHHARSHVKVINHLVTIFCCFQCVQILYFPSSFFRLMNT